MEFVKCAITMYLFFKRSALTITALLFGFILRAQTSCNTLLFKPVDHIKNGSLEQINTSCEKYLFTDTSRRSLSMKQLVPFWQSPMFLYQVINYLGVCNGFTLGYDDVTYDRNRSPGDNSHLTHLPIVPQPIPDGNGVLGLLSNRSQAGTPSTDLYSQKNYICTNLFRTLKKDSTYRLDFSLGFGLKDSLGEAFLVSDRYVRFSLFGLTDSTKTPFFIPANKRGANLGCLTQNFPDWVPLGSVVISGDKNSWVNTSLTFTSTGNFQSIAIGPACDMSDLPMTPLGNNEAGYYYFLDNLRFYQASSPKPILEVSAGSFCDGPNASLTLHMKSDTFYKGSQLQWYKNNTAIPETGGSVTLTKNQFGEGWYQCGVTNDSVCIRSDSFHVFWDPYINATIGNHPDTTACNGDTVLLNVAGGNNANYLWSDGSSSPSIRVTKSGSYSVSVSNSCNTHTTVKNVLFADCPPQLYVPSAFTPNHDGLNDVFRAFYKGKVNTFSLSVYNRYGQRIFFSDEISKGWDGSFQRNQQDSGTYVWVVQYTDGNNISHTEKGTILLIR